MGYYRGFQCGLNRFLPAKKISSLEGLIGSSANLISWETVEYSSQSRRGSRIERVPDLFLFLYGEPRGCRF